MLTRFRNALWLVVIAVSIAWPAFAGPTAERLVRGGLPRETAAAIERHLDRGPGPAVAVFDHDLTLLHGDVCNGEPGLAPGFFRDLVDRGQLKPEGLAHVSAASLPDPLARFEALKKTDTDAAYAWRNQLLAGYGEEELAARAREYYARWCAPHLYPAMRVLTTVLAERGAEVYVVTAAPAVIIKACASHLAIRPERVLGIGFRIRDGKITDRLSTPVIYGPGKVWLIETGVRPVDPARLMVFGDSYSNDGYMLRYAKRHGGLAVMINPDAGERKQCRRMGFLEADIAPPRAARPGR